MEEVGHVEGEPRADDDLFICLYLQLLLPYVLLQLLLCLFLLLVQRFVAVLALVAELSEFYWLLRGEAKRCSSCPSF